jgi:MFS transporter, PPP family, 3-phenylpropionic acid transporter
MCVNRWRNQQPEIDQTIEWGHLRKCCTASGQTVNRDYSPASVAWRIAVFYSAIFVVLGVSLPYFPLWLKWQNLTPLEIGLVTSVPLFIRIVATPMIGFAADRANSVRRIVVIAGAFGLLSSALLMAASGIWMILVLFTVFQVSSMAMMPLAEVAAMQGVREKGLDYGQMRLWGSVAFIAANIGGGLLIAAHGNGTIMPILVGGCFLALIAGWFLPDRKAAPAQPARRLDWDEISATLAHRGLLLVMLAGGVIQASHAVYYAFSAIHWQSQGIDGRWFGILWGVGVVAEVLLFAYAGRLLARIGALAMIGIGAAGSVVRWGLMATDPSFGVLLVLQLFHGLTFGATHLGTVHAIQERVGADRAASAQALHSALSSGILMGMTTMLAGAVYGPLLGGSYLVMVVLALVGGALVMLASSVSAGSKQENANPKAPE